MTSYTVKNRADIVVEELRKETVAATISCHNINYVVDVKENPCSRVHKKQILRDISGIFKTGMNAILGPTGSGKTSLLDIIAGRKDTHGLRGEVLVNGLKQPKNFKCMTGYVVQDDVVMGTLTVRENFLFSAGLRLPKDVTDDEKKLRVSDIITELGLTHCADSKVGNAFIRGVSGGERKRTNIGMELITSPPVLFLDEPTTGLDASTAHAVMLLLHSLSRKGNTIIFSIHQPRYSIYKMFDRLMLLALGHTVYHGPAPDALDYFSGIGFECEVHNNPADYFLDVINGDSTSVQISQDGEDAHAEKLSTEYSSSKWHDQMKKEVLLIEEAYHEKTPSGDEVELSQGEYATSFSTQLKYVCWRGILNIIRNPQTSFVQYLVVIIFALLSGIVYFDLTNVMPAAIQNRVGALFFIIMNQVFSNLSAIELFISERAIFIHENASGFYRVSSYFFAKVISDIIPQRLIPLLIMCAISYFMVGFQLDVAKFFFFVLTLFLTSTAGSAIAFLLSACFQVFAIANLFIALIFVFMMVFSGLLVNLESMADWLSWVQYFSIFRYSLNALCINELKDAIFCTEYTFNETLYSKCDNTTGNAYLEDQGIPYETTWDLWFNVLALFMIGFGFMTFAWIRLLRIKKFK